MYHKYNEKHKVFSYIDRELNQTISAVSLAKVPFFYCSTGVNSGNKGTWFPCYGIKDGWIIKPDPAHMSFPKDFLKFLNDRFLDKQISFPLTDEQQKECKDTDELIRKQATTFLSRFGNMESLLYSYAIGGGYWETENSRILRYYLDAAYGNVLQDLKHNFPEIPVLKNPPPAPPEQEFRVDLSPGGLPHAKPTLDKLKNALEEERSLIVDRKVLNIQRPEAPPLPPRKPKPVKSNPVSQSFFKSNREQTFWEKVGIMKKPETQKDLKYVLQDYINLYLPEDKRGSTPDIKKQAATCLLQWLNNPEKPQVLSSEQVTALTENSHLADIFAAVQDSEFYDKNSDNLVMGSTPRKLF